MSRFRPLEVVEIRRETRDSVVLTLRPRPEDAAAFAFVQGQYLTFRRVFDGEELRRCYSICSGVDEGRLQVGIRRLEGGAFSSWANDELRPGETLEAAPPAGRFHVPLDPEAARVYLAFAGGAGITPILSILKTTLAREPRATVTLVYANRHVGSIMFREEIEDLKNLHLGRLSVIHILESEGREIDLFSGRIDAAKMDALFRLWIDAGTVDYAFVCGPEPMMLTVADGLRRHGLDEERIRFELFATAQTGRAKPRPPAPRAAATGGGECEVSVTIDGARHGFRMPKRGLSVLDAALANAIDAPFSCKAGVCSTCRARVIEGEVEMAVNHALEDYEVRAGYVLSCQCSPLSDRLALSYDE